MTDDKLRAALEAVTDKRDCEHGHRDVIHIAPSHFDGPACPECSDAEYADRMQREEPCVICAALAASATDEGPLPTAADLRGLAPGMTDGLSSEEYVRSIRDARPAVPALDVEIARVAFRRAQAQGISFDLLVFWRHFAREYAALSPKEPIDDR